jgi:serpin B
MMHRRLLSLLSLSLAVIAACSHPRQPEPTERSDLPPAARATNTLATSLLHEVGKADGNLFLSPLSIELALGMAGAGASGTSADELSALLGLPVGEAGSHGALADLALRVTSNADVTMRIANRIYVADRLTVEPPYAALTRDI